MNLKKMLQVFLKSLTNYYIKREAISLWFVFAYPLFVLSFFLCIKIFTKKLVGQKNIENKTFRPTYEIELSVPLPPEDSIQQVSLLNFSEINFTGLVGPVLFIATILIFFYFSHATPKDTFSEATCSSLHVEDLLQATNLPLQTLGDSLEAVPSSLDASFFTPSSDNLLESIAENAINRSILSNANESVLQFLKIVKYQMVCFLNTIYEDPEDPLFMFKEVHSYFDSILAHYETILTSMKSKICFLGGFSLDGPFDDLGAVLNVKFHNLTLLFVSYCQGMAIIHWKDALFVEKVSAFLEKFLNTSYLCIPLKDIRTVLVDESNFLTVLERVEVQEVLRTYSNLLSSWGLYDPTMLRSVFHSTILTLHALNDLVVSFVAELCEFYTHLSSVVPLVL